MRGKRFVVFTVTFLFLLTYLVTNAVPVSALPILKKGQRGDSVKQLQVDLKDLGYFSINPTGYYGDITVDSVRKFQSSKGLSVDGVAGPKTLSAINTSISGAYQSVSLLKEGMRNSSVKRLQQDLKKLGFFDFEATGYYGQITVNAVKSLQKNYGLYVDGIAGKNTFGLLMKLLNGDKAGDEKTEASRLSERGSTNYLMNWFGGVEDIFKRGSIATVYDIDTGINFQVKRTYGTNHADCEPLTAADAAAMKKAYGGSWSWSRRAIVVKADGYAFAASMNGMPHAGLDSKSEGAMISDRAGGYGYGYNYDTVKGNNFNGHFCIHFYSSRTHGSNRVDPNHSKMVQKAARWLESNR